MSEDNENLFLGTTNSYDESEVDIEVEYMVVVDEIERCRKRNKVLKEKLSKYQEETNHCYYWFEKPTSRGKEEWGRSSSYSREENSRFWKTWESNCLT